MNDLNLRCYDKKEEKVLFEGFLLTNTWFTSLFLITDLCMYVFNLSGQKLIDHLEIPQGEKYLFVGKFTIFELIYGMCSFVVIIL